MFFFFSASTPPGGLKHKCVRHMSVRMHTYQQTRKTSLFLRRVRLHAYSAAWKLANHNHFLTLNSVSHAALLGWEAPAECILSSNSHTLHASAPGGWAQHQHQGSESILICQYEILDYHWGRLPGPHVREVYNGRGSRKEGERNGRRPEEDRERNGKLPVLPHGEPHRPSCKPGALKLIWIKRKELQQRAELREGEGGAWVGSQGHCKGGCHSMSPSARYVCVYITHELSAHVCVCVCVCCDGRLRGEGWGGQNILFASRLEKSRQSFNCNLQGKLRG